MYLRTTKKTPPAVSDWRGLQLNVQRSNERPREAYHDDGGGGSRQGAVGPTTSEGHILADKPSLARSNSDRADESPASFLRPRETYNSQANSSSPSRGCEVCS